MIFQLRNLICESNLDPPFEVGPTARILMKNLTGSNGQDHPFFNIYLRISKSITVNHSSMVAFDQLCDHHTSTGLKQYTLCAYFMKCVSNKRMIYMIVRVNFFKMST